MRPVFPRLNLRNALIALFGALAVFVALDLLLPVELGLAGRIVTLGLGLVLAFGFWAFYRKAPQVSTPETESESRRRPIAR